MQQGTKMKLDKIRFARLISYLSRNAGGDLCVDEIERIDDIISFDAPQPDVAYPSTSDINMLMHLMAAGTQKIEAIKVHRKLTGYGLKESKDQVEKYWVARAAKPDATLGEILQSATS